MPSFYFRGTNSTIGTVKKQSDQKQTRLHCLQFSATATCVVTLTGGSTVYVIDVAVGIQEFEYPLIFPPGEDVTIAVNNGGTASVFGEASATY